MCYQKANKILPENLVELIQKYIDGGYVYIPEKQENREDWEESSRTKEEFRRRNRGIFTKYGQGMGVKSLIEQHFLSEKGIQRTVFQEEEIFQEEKILQETKDQGSVPD